MTKRDVLAVALRIVGVYFAIQAVMTVATLGSAVLVVFEPKEVEVNVWVFLATMLLVSALYVGIAAVLLTKADTLAQRFVKESDSIPAVGAADWEKPVFGLALKIIGVVYIAMGLADMGRTFAAEVMRWPHWPKHQTGLFVLAGLLSCAVEAGLPLAVGAYLLTGARRLVAFAFRPPAAEREKPGFCGLAGHPRARCQRDGGGDQAVPRGEENRIPGRAGNG